MFKFSKQKKEEITKKVVRSTVKKNSKMLTDKLETIKKRMINEFLKHPVTKEINSGPYGDHITGTLSNVSGNLFSFIGFDEGSDPIQPILSILQNIEVKILEGSNSTYILINYPSALDIFSPDVTPMPRQEGRSWAKGIESGISGLNYYLFSEERQFNTSASGTAIQTDNKLRSYARYMPTQYISTLLKKYKTIFSSQYAKNKSVFVSIEPMQ